ncbi:MAG: L,D-transpeptidase family protein [Polyangiaceae bacterium]|nr:L,D-transpeptidase family protein [Polyangiaceae bacterium]
MPVPPSVSSAASASPSAQGSIEELEPGHGARLASIAMRTWVYDAPTERSDKLGYLRAGALVDRAERSAGTDGCDGGWYRVSPRGYACVGKGASLDTQHPIVQAAPRGPRRGEPTPYTYVMSAAPPPHLYFRLPSEADQARVEGSTYKTHVALHEPRLSKLETDTVPPFLLEGNDLPKPYGSDKNLSYSVHRGRAPENSAFGLMSVFDWTGRRFGLTTELDLIPLDRTKPATVSELVGVKLEQGGAPAFVVPSGTSTFKQVGTQFQESGTAKGRTGWELTGKTHGGEHGLHETTQGVWLPAPGIIIGELRKDRARHAERGKKWISVSIGKQMLIAYEGEKPVYASLVSTGRGGMSDPEETFATVRGTFMIRAKHVSGTMDGNQGEDESFDLRDVPYIQYFHEGYALHAAYWHDDFGKVRSHGCVNLPPASAAWLFDWTDPPVPKEWHGAVAPQGGTMVYIHK